MVGVADSAFDNLFRISENLLFSDLDSLQHEKAFDSLRGDSRWLRLVGLVEENMLEKQMLSLVQTSPERGQLSSYVKNIKIADSLYAQGDFRASADHFSEAFRSLGWKGTLEHRYRAAKSWSMVGVADSAFDNLFRISEKLLFSDLDSLRHEEAFNSLRGDSRWLRLVGLVEENVRKKQVFGVIRDSLVQMLKVDQQLRAEIGDIWERYGLESPEAKKKGDEIGKADSLHWRYASEVINRYGWLSGLELGSEGNAALFFIILHSPYDIQAKYLPLVRQAFAEKKVDPHNYSLFEDKVSLAEKGYQLYGTQVGMDEAGKNFVHPIKDKENVNERRKELGVAPLEDYLKYFGIESY